MQLPAWLFRTHRFLRYPRLSKLPLGVEITLILVVKIALLTVLAKTFFSEPQAKKMRMPTALVEQHLLAPATTTPLPLSSSPAPAAPTFSPTTEVTHASH